MFFEFALLTVAVILIDAGWTKRSPLDVIRGVHSTQPNPKVSNDPSLQGIQPGTLTGRFQNWVIGRRDQGIDLTAKTPNASLPALGKSRVVGILPNWYNGQPYVWLEALDGPLKGHYYYYAEQISHIAKPGTVLNDGDAVAYYAPHGTGVEAGLATANGVTLAKSTTGYHEGQDTPAADMFAKLLGL